MLEKIRTLNPDYQINELDDSFKEYGRIIKQDMQEAINYATTYQNTNAYDTSVQALEEMPCIQDLINDIYGYLDVMAGVVTGKNEVLNGLEYHQCSETIIAAKNDDNSETVYEIADLIYHLTVMMVKLGIPLEDVLAELDKRSEKTGNLKKFHVVDKNS